MVTVRTEKQYHLGEVTEKDGSQRRCLLPLTAIGPYLSYAVSVNFSFLMCEMKMIISAQPNIIRSHYMKLRYFDVL